MLMIKTKHPPMMQTTDLSLRMDPSYGPISKHFHKNPKEFHDAFARAWFKLTHRDMGPKVCYLGSRCPKRRFNLARSNSKAKI